MKTDEMQNIMQNKMTDEAGTLLEIRNLKVRFTTRKKVLTAVDGVSLSIRPGEIVGVVGESGSGKSVMSQSILRLREYDSDVNYEGQVLFEGKPAKDAVGDLMLRDKRIENSLLPWD